MSLLIFVSTTACCWIFALIAAIWLVRSARALAVRLARYASANACEPACAAAGVGAGYVIASTVVSGGTAIVTPPARVDALAVDLSSLPAAEATWADVTSWASVSRLIADWVRPPVTLGAVAEVGVTRTSAVAW